MNPILYDPITPKEMAYARKVKCAYRNCPCDAINSHLLQKGRWLKDIAEDGKVLQMSDDQLQSLIDGDEKGNIYSLLSINKALSLPIFCQQHDQKLFKEFEVKDLELTNEVHFLKLSYRAFCATLAQEKRRNIFYELNPTVNPICSGELFDEQKRYSDFVVGVFADYMDDMFSHVKSNNASDYLFQVVRTDRFPICLSDVIIKEDDLLQCYLNQHQPYRLYPIFVHAIPYENESVLIMGYNKRECNRRIEEQIKRWVNTTDKAKVISEWMVKTNNWCVTPSSFGNDPEAVCESIFRRKVDYTFH